VAKEAATLDVLSGGRLILGIGVGWLREEFQALGIPFEERAARTAEMVRAMRSLWKEAPEAFEGRFFRWPPLESNPKPVQRPGVPIIVGGHTDLAARRAARYGDGFFPGVAEPEKLRHLLGVLREECDKVGRDLKAIEVTAGSFALDRDALARLRDLGVHRVVTFPPGFDPESVERGLADLRERVIRAG
jgi:probable F420-dependent oxidoreductase